MLPCPFCDVWLKNSLKLKQHIKVHTGFEADFNCAHCEENFRTKEDLQAHFSSVQHEKLLTKQFTECGRKSKIKPADQAGNKQRKMQLQSEQSEGKC